MPALVAGLAEAAPVEVAEMKGPGMYRQYCTVMLVALLAMPASAQHGQGGGPPTFEEFDLNGDGVIGEAELYEARGKRIAERAAEGRPMRHLSQAPAFADLDTDGSGAIEPAEFAHHQAQHRHRVKSSEEAQPRD